MTENPYTSPVADGIADVSPPSDEATFGEMAKAVFLAWERLRIVYVAVLGVLTLLLFAPLLLASWTVVMIVEGAVVANVCFFAGPVVETYVRWLGYKEKWVRWSLFGSGTLLTATLVVVLALASQGIPNQN